MSLADYLILALVAVAAVAALVRARRHPGCGGGCAGCSLSCSRRTEPKNHQ